MRAPFRQEKLTPAAKLDRLRIAVRPAEAALSPLPGPRDALPDGRTAHALVLTYKFSLLEDGKVTPVLPMLNRCARRRSAGLVQLSLAACRSVKLSLTLWHFGCVTPSY